MPGTGAPHLYRFFHSRQLPDTAMLCIARGTAIRGGKYLQRGSDSCPVQKRTPLSRLATVPT